MRCCGVRVDVADLGRATSAVLALARRGRAAEVHLCTADTLGRASRDAELAAALHQSDLNLPDGAPLVFLARRLGFDGVTAASRPRGTDLLLEVADQGRAENLRHYLYGSTPAVVGALAASLRRRLPGVHIVGVESPPFGSLDAGELAESARRMRETRPGVVWVGLGTPKQDHAVHALAPLVGAPVVAVGAAFDFVAGAKTVAPRWVQRSYLEWLYRLGCEPVRLWRRYLVGNLVFVGAVVRGGTARADA